MAVQHFCTAIIHFSTVGGGCKTALRHGHERTQAIIDAAPDGVISIDHEERIIAIRIEAYSARVKLTSTCVTTSTGTPLSSVWAYVQVLTASIAA